MTRFKRHTISRAAVLAAACLIGLVSGSVAPTALAQQPARAERNSDLVQLARILGASHHLLRVCEPDEDQFWRERMRQLVELETPTLEQRDRMIAAFNDGYRGAQRTAERCDRGAREEADRMAANGRAVADRLAAGLDR